MIFLVTQNKSSGLSSLSVYLPFLNRTCYRSSPPVDNGLFLTISQVSRTGLLRQVKTIIGIFGMGSFKQTPLMHIKCTFISGSNWDSYGLITPIKITGTEKNAFLKWFNLIN